mgnify:CR=1 FL=1
MSNKKLTEQEIKQISDLQQQNNSLVNELGQISLLEINLTARKKAAEDFLVKLREAEADLAKALEDKYGAGSINLETGEFQPTPQTATTPSVEVES